LRKYAPALDAAGEVTTEGVNRWVQDIHLVHGWSENHANYTLRALRAVVNAVADAKMTRAFDRLRLEVKNARGWPSPKKHKRNPPPDVVQRALRAARNEGEQHFIVLIARLGLRVDEMLGLTATSYEPHERLLVVDGQRRNPQNRKAHGDDLVKALSADSCRRIEWLICKQATLASRRGRRRGAPIPGFLFPWGPSYMANFMGRIRDVFGVDASRYFPKRNAWHVFRHFSANLVKKAGGGAEGIQRHLGHKTPRTAQTYMDEFRGEGPTLSGEVTLPGDE
jgi:integrase